MKRVASLITGLALAVSAFNATARDTKPSAQPVSNTNSPSSAPPRRIASVLGALDTDRDRVISAQEIAGAPTALLKLDKNGDHQISGDELQPVRRTPRSVVGSPSMAGSADPQTIKPQPPLLVTTLDLDGDGKLSGQEIAQAAVALRKLDKNNDGQLTRAEYRPSLPRSAGLQLDEGKSDEQRQAPAIPEPRPRASRSRAAAK
jgi:Ca2+-binding EF-hand superfamily protein